MKRILGEREFTVLGRAFVHSNFHRYFRVVDSNNPSTNTTNSVELTTWYDSRHQKQGSAVMLFYDLNSIGILSWIVYSVSKLFQYNCCISVYKWIEHLWIGQVVWCNVHSPKLHPSLWNAFEDHLPLVSPSIRY